MSTTIVQNAQGRTTIVKDATSTRTLGISTRAAVTLVNANRVGPSGPPGQGFEHTQTTPASTWVVNHNLGLRPSVSVRSSGGVELLAEVVHMSANQTEIRFVTPYTGTARFT